MQQPGLEYRGHVEYSKVYTWVLKYTGNAHNQAGLRKGSWFGAKSGQAVLFSFFFLLLAFGTCLSEMQLWKGKKIN